MPQLVTSNWVLAMRGCGSLGFLHTPVEEYDSEEARHDGYPEHRAKIIRPGKHQPHSNQRTEKSAHGIERLAQTERRPAQAVWCNVGHQCITRCATDPFTDAVDEPRSEHDSGTRRQREQRLGQ